MIALVLALLVLAFLAGHAAARADEKAADAYATGHSDGMTEQQRIDGLEANVRARWAD